MKDKIFYIIVSIVVAIGITTSVALSMYTINLSKSASITAYISNER